MSKYYVIDVSANGSYLREYNAEEMQEFLDEVNEYSDEHKEEQPFLEEVEQNGVDLTAKGGYYIIKGELIVPKEKEVVTKLTVE